MRIYNDELNISISIKSYEHMVKMLDVKKILDRYPKEDINKIEDLVFNHGITSNSFVHLKRIK